MIPQLPLSEWAAKISPSASPCRMARRMPLVCRWTESVEVAHELVHEAGHVRAEGGEGRDHGRIEGRQVGRFSVAPGKDA